MPTASDPTPADAGPDHAAWVEGVQTRWHRTHQLCGTPDLPMACASGICASVEPKAFEPRWLRYVRRPRGYVEETLMAWTGDRSWSRCVRAQNDQYRHSQPMLLESAADHCIVHIRPGETPSLQAVRQLCDELATGPWTPVDPSEDG